jgi:hypothetical protein
MSVRGFREAEQLLKMAHEDYEIKSSSPVPSTGLEDRNYRLHIVNFVFEQIETPTSELAKKLALLVEDWTQYKNSDQLRELMVKFLEGPRSK